MALIDETGGPSRVLEGPCEAPSPSGPPRLLLTHRESPGVETLRSLLDDLDGEWELVAAAADEVESLAADGRFTAIVLASEDDDPCCFDTLAAFSTANPDASKIILADKSHWDSLEHSEHVIHHVAKSSSANQISDQLNRIVLLDRWMMRPGIRELVKRMGRLPTLPTLYDEVTRELNSPNGSMETIADIISKDPSLAAQMLKRVNSAFFSLAQPITDLKDAVLFLGGERIRSLLLLGSLMGRFNNAACEGFDPEEFLRHSMETANYARAIARKVTRKAREMDFAYTAGLLHDLGKLLLAANMPDVCTMLHKAVKDGNLDLLSTEEEFFGVTHAEVGGCLLAQWGMPASIIKAVGFHHQPRLSGTSFFNPLVAVHAANGLDHQLQIKGDDAEISTMDVDFLTSIGLAGQVEDWRETCAGLNDD